MWESETDSVSGQDYANGVLSLSKHGLSSDGFELRGNSWYVSTDVPSDLIVGIGDYSFYLHKYMLLCKSAKMSRIIQEAHIPDLNKVVLDDLPGGSAAFELAAKFCYGIAFDLTASNVSSVRCAAEYLEMTEDLEEGNLIFKTEAFLSYVVLTSWRDSVIVLKGCEKLSPWPENLQIVRRCCESIAWKACADPKGIKWAYTGKPLNVSSLKWDDTRDSSPSRNQLVPPDWWFEDVSALRINHFVRVITAIKVKGMRVELTGAAIMHYAGKWLPGLVQDGVDAGEEGSITSFSHSSGHSSRKGEIQMITAGTTDELPMSQAKDQRLIIESLISILPPQKDSIKCSFLLRLLRMANTLNVAPALVTELEKRVAVQFEQATLADLLIPSYNKGETIYDVDVVQRLLEHFLVQEQTESPSPSRKSFSDKQVYDGTQRKSFSEKQLYDGAQRITNQNAKMRVARLVDSYLTEVAKDKNLTLTKFQALAEALPESARTCDDGLYRAIDSYLKAHPTLSEHERKRLCRVMDCQKLSMDACIHAAQNERLPLRVVVQVLLSEQVKISNAVTNNSLKVNGEAHYQPLVPNRKAALEGTPLSYQEGWTVSRKDINTLKFELESMKAKYLELQNDFETLQRQFDKLSKQKHSSAWTSGWKKLSKLTRKSTAGNQVIEHHLTETVEHIEDAPKRWRNSVS